MSIINVNSPAQYIVPKRKESIRKGWFRGLRSYFLFLFGYPRWWVLISGAHIRHSFSSFCSLVASSLVHLWWNEQKWNVKKTHRQIKSSTVGVWLKASSVVAHIRPGGRPSYLFFDPFLLWLYRTPKWRQKIRCRRFRREMRKRYGERKRPWRNVMKTDAEGGKRKRKEFGRLCAPLHHQNSQRV